MRVKVFAALLVMLRGDLLNLRIAQHNLACLVIRTTLLLCVHVCPFSRFKFNLNDFFLPSISWVSRTMFDDVPTVSRS